MGPEGSEQERIWLGEVMNARREVNRASDMASMK